MIREWIKYAFQVYKQEVIFFKIQILEIMRIITTLAKKFTKN